MSLVESVLISAILWVVHFLQSPEGQVILATTESEIITELEAMQQTGTTPPQTPTGPPATASPTSPAAASARPALFDPRKRSSATNEQTPPEG